MVSTRKSHFADESGFKDPLKKDLPKRSLRFGPVWPVLVELNDFMPLLSFPRKMVRLASLNLHESGIQFRPQRWHVIYRHSRGKAAALFAL